VDFFNLLHRRYKNDGIPIIKLKNYQLKTLGKIKEKIEEGIYRFEKIPCCICKKDSFELLSEKERHGFYYPLVICKTCGLIQNNPRLNQESYLDFYETLYRRFLSGKSKPTEKYFEKQYNRGIKIIDFLTNSKVLNKKDKNLFVFEVGCGAGGVLKAFKDQGFTIQGCDLDTTYLNYGRDKHKLTLHHGTLNQTKFERPPDIIIYSHVLEHILYPVEELSQIYNILNENGYLYIEVPGVGNIKNSHDMNFLHYLHYHHVYHFTLTTLRNLLYLNGFRLIDGNNFIRSVFKKSDFSKSYEIKSDYNDTMNFLKKIEKSRKFLLLNKIIRLSTYYLKNERDIRNFSLKNQIKYLLLGYLKQIRIFKKIIYKLIK
jgi:SAM-dependent methyltransferase